MPNACAGRQTPLAFFAPSTGGTSKELSAEELVALLPEGGYWYEARLLETPGLLQSAETLLREGRSITSVCPNYPRRLLERLGPLAPPALWCSEPLPEVSFGTIVGSRVIPRPIQRFAAQAAQSLIANNLWVLTGGAQGTDRAAALVDYTVEIWPFGIEYGSREKWGSRSALILSVAAPEEGFGTGLAMERNLLLHAGGEASLICHARYRAGGSWNGAIEALRRRVGHLHVPPETLFVDEDARNAIQSLASLGALPLESASEFGERCAMIRVQRFTYPRFMPERHDAVSEARFQAALF